MNKINIAGIEYRVKLCTVIEHGTNAVGMIDFLGEVISIRKDLSQARVRQTLMHEVVHGILDSIGYHELNEDERFITVFANTLTQVLLNNPKFTREFTQDDCGSKE